MIGKITKAIAVVRTARSTRNAIATIKRLLAFIDDMADNHPSIEQQHTTEDNPNASSTKPTDVSSTDRASSTETGD